MLVRIAPYLLALVELHRNQPLDRNPWPAAEAEVFTAARAWAVSPSPQEAVRLCSDACERLAETPGASFVNYCENGREMANIIGMYLSQLKGETVTRSDILEELDRLELGYIEETVVSDMTE